MKVRINSRAIITIVLGFFLFCFIVFIKEIFYKGSFQGMGTVLIFYSLGKLAGLMGFFFLSLLIISGETARFFDKFFGMDKIIKFQRKFALMTMILVLSHPIFFVLSSNSILPYIIPDFSILPLTLGIISFYIFVVVMIASKMYKMISYNVWQYIHIITYMLFFLSLYHAFNLGSDAGSWLIIAVYSILLLSVIIGIIYRTSYKIRQRYTGKFHVEDIINETKDTFTIALRPEKPFLFKAGQFCFLRLDRDKLYARHPFTIASSPKEDKLRFTVKLAGRFTKSLYDLKKGDEVIVDGPFGIFTIEDDQKDLVFIAGGVGVVPFISMIRDKIAISKKQIIVLMYGSKTKEDIIYGKELDDINEDWLKKVYLLSHDSFSSKTHGYEDGYITEETIKKYVKNISNSLFYICGPESMKNSVKKILGSIGVNKQSIIIEDFFW